MNIISKEIFAKEAESAVESLPDIFKEKMKNVDIVIEDKPLRD